jgi:beta-carotene hydroxylase
MVETQHIHSKPSIKDLGIDLLTLTKFERLATILIPFVFFLFYFAFAMNSYWIPAILCTMGLSFSSYGSTSHDLVHENLKINKTLNTFFLSFLELICFRSGHAYKLSHLHHHKRYPHDDDVEGAASKMTLLRTLIEGIIFQFKIYYWALTQYKHHKYYRLVIMEGIMILILVSFCIYSLSFTNIYFYYMCLMIAGSWIIPFVTSYLVHTPDGADELSQTRLFRGSFFSVIAFNHLFHLEHHLYPMVPHKNWPKLARRLDMYFEAKGIVPMKVKF